MKYLHRANIYKMISGSLKSNPYKKGLLYFHQFQKKSIEVNLLTDVSGHFFVSLDVISKGLQF